MNTENKTYTLDRVVRMVITTISVIGILYLIKYLSPVLIPFFIAIFIVYLLNPLVQYFQDKLKLKKRIFAVLLTLLCIGAIVTIISIWLVPLFVNEGDVLRIDTRTREYITRVK